MFDIFVPTTMRDLTLIYGPNGRAISANAATNLQRISIQAPVGVEVASSVSARELTIESTLSNSITLATGGSLILDTATLSGGINGIFAGSGSSLDITNVLVFNVSQVGIDLSASVTGSMNFVTIADTGFAASTVNAAGIFCSTSLLAVRSSVVWTPTSNRVPISGCSIATTSIAGPIGVVGAMNVDPQFVNPQNRDYHLKANSPAKDVAETGPVTDFEGDARPVNRYDLGADEVRP